MSLRRINLLNTNMDGLINTEEDGTFSNRIIHETYDQINQQFHPAAKIVAEAGSDLLRSLDDLNKSSNYYIKALHILVDSGQNCCLLTKQQIHEIRDTTDFMWNMQRILCENTKNFARYIILANQCNRWNKANLKAMQNTYKEREKELRKKSKTRDKSGLEIQRFYEYEHNQIVLKQHQLYKFFADKNKEWILGYVGIAQQLTYMFHTLMEIFYDDEHEVIEKRLMIEESEMTESPSTDGHESEKDNLTSQFIHGSKYDDKVYNSQGTTDVSDGHLYRNDRSKDKYSSVGAENASKLKYAWKSEAYQHVIDELIYNDFRFSALTPSPFSKSDYGKTLVCIEKFKSLSCNQLDLSPGDRVELIRCGPKGWLLVKDNKNEGIGWLPSKNVKFNPRKW